jgi:AraC-like DNA-binding protein
MVLDAQAFREEWIRVPIGRIEDLRDAVYGAGLDATQMTTGGLSGSLAFSQRDGILYGSGFIVGTVALTGPLSLDKVTIGLGLDVSPGTWHWMREVGTGAVGVFHPGDEHDSRYTPGTLYSTLTLDADRLEEEAAREDLVLDRKTLGGTGFHSRLLDPGVGAWLRRQLACVHGGGFPATGGRIGDVMLRAAIQHYGRATSSGTRDRRHNPYAAIVRRARAYVQEHLSEPISLDSIARAAFASRRTLYRAFSDILNDTPQGYVRRLRLHRIRHNLATDVEQVCTIALVANQWGMSELGRMSAWYRQLFGERPSETHAHARDFKDAHLQLLSGEANLAKNA